jgi:hypothetical protein
MSNDDPTGIQRSIAGAGPRSPERRVAPEMDAETALLDAEYLAELLEKDPKRSTRLFAEALTALARSLRLAIIAEANHEELLRMHLRLESTMKMAYAEVLPQEQGDVEPASQRPTMPYPVDFPTAEDVAGDSGDREAVTVRHPRPISEVRRRVSLPVAPARRGPIGWTRALRR